MLTPPTLDAFARDVRYVARVYQAQGFPTDEAREIACLATFGALCQDRPDLAREIADAYKARDAGETRHTSATRPPRCHGAEDADGKPACLGDDVRTVRALEPGAREWFTTDWCADCRHVAKVDGYKVVVMTVPND